MKRLISRLLLCLVPLAMLPGCGVFAPLPAPIEARERINQFSLDDAPLAGDVSVYWDEHMIPFIEAEYDGDAAFTLGMVQAHLRLGQMETMKRIAAGRVSEMAGPYTVDMDAGLRALGFGRAADEILAAMPEHSRHWLDRYVDGINFYRAQLPPDRLPHEYTVMGFDPDEKWTARDTITIGRLSGTDVNWMSWFRLLEQYGNGNWDDVWRNALGFANGTTSFERLTEYSKSGSNSLVIASERSESGGALIANDPHLGMQQPNIWIIAGLHSPSYHAVGMMLPGTPVFGFGRTPHIAWGGTNMRSLNSDLVDVTDLPEEAFDVEEHRIKVRWWPERTVRNRISPYGPVMSDTSIFPGVQGRDLAVGWVGHMVTDEITALLDVTRARNHDEFVTALERFAIPAQNFLYADRHGHIGQVMATIMPMRPQDYFTDLIVSPEQHRSVWNRLGTVRDFPLRFDPPSGFVASANNRPVESDFLIGLFFPPDERIRRFNEIMNEQTHFSVNDLMRIQQDTKSLASLELRDAILSRLEDNGPLQLTDGGVAALDIIRTWDGFYDAGSRGAAVFETFLAHFVEPVYDNLIRGGDTIHYSRGAEMRPRLAADMERLPTADLSRLARVALNRAGRLAQDGTVWGDLHRIRLKHMLGNVPVIGDRYVFADYPAGGSNETIMKTAHNLTAERHGARYGAQSRHISDMADPDANWFVLLGGQDGWLGSSAFMDQVDLWFEGAYIQVPLQLAAVRTHFPYVTRFRRGETLTE